MIDSYGFLVSFIGCLLSFDFLSFLSLAHSRLAPIQATLGHGHPLPPGSPSIDYFISSSLFYPSLGDITSENVKLESHINDQVVLFDSLSVVHPPIPNLETDLRINDVTREDLGLTDEDHIYVLLQHSKKFHPTFDEVILQILERDQFAKLLFLNGSLAHMHLRWSSSPSFHPHLQKFKFLPRVEHGRLLKIFSISDVMLDTFPWGGGVTASEAIQVLICKNWFYQNRFYNFISFLLFFLHFRLVFL